MSKKKNMFNLLFLAAVLILTNYAVFSKNSIKDIVSYMSQADMRLWLLAVVFVIIFIGGEAVVTYYMMNSIGQNVSAGRCYEYAAIGFFFSCITPGASGGQPLQLYFMRKDKIPVSLSTLVLLIITLTYKLVLVITGTAVFIFRPKAVMQYIRPVIGWCYLGYALNIFAITMMFLLIFHPTMARSIANLVFRFLKHIHFIKEPEKFKKKVDNACDAYQDVAGYFKAHKMLIVNVLLITFVQRFIMFSVTYLVYRSFHFSGMSCPLIAVLQAMISVAADMLPLPGGSGITEKLFSVIFYPVFKDMTASVLIVSRGISYYAQVIISAAVTLAAYIKIRKG